MSQKDNKFYITAAIPYVNAKPHIGHALEFIQTDAIARYQRLLGKETLALSGSDENALKNIQAAAEAKIPIQRFVDDNARAFLELAETLNVHFDVFQKGSSPVHHESSQKLWQLCDGAGDIYKKPYQGLYCLGCEAFYTLDELDASGECFEHPGRKLEKVSEENYFFRLSKYREKLIRLIAADELKITPVSRKNEALSFLERPLEDISISRSNERAKNWGVPVPNDPSQRIYVWFDGLNVYQSGVGFGWDEAKYKKWWPADMHVIGKGILRFHAVYWPAFLLSAGLPLPKSLFVHGYITVEGQKMSKTLGNVVDPFSLVSRYGVDALRYYLLRTVPAYGDGDFSEEKMKELYNGELANGIGNLVARVAKLGEKVNPIHFKETDLDPGLRHACDDVEKKYREFFQELQLNEALGYALRLVGAADRYINDRRPWAIQDDIELRRVLASAGFLIAKFADFIEPFIPDTAGKMRSQVFLEGNEIKIKKGEGLFPRL